MIQLTATASMLLTLATSSSSMGGFRGCQDAFNHAHNTARLYVGQSFSRARCDATKLPGVEDTLARVFKRLVLRTSDSDHVKACYYDGLYSGYIEGLLDEYDACPGPAFAALGLDSVARAAQSVFIAMYGALPYSLTTSTVKNTFSIDYAFLAPDQNQAECIAIIEEGSQDDLPWNDRTATLTRTVTSAVCSR